MNPPVALLLFLAGLAVVFWSAGSRRCPGPSFYLPVAFATVMTVSLFLWRGGLPRWGRGALVLLYLVFAVGGFLL